MKVLIVFLICCLVAPASSANLKGKDDETLKELNRQGYKQIGGGYFKNSFEYFFANSAHDPKLWTKLDSVDGSLKSLGSNYATDSFNAYFEGKKFETDGNLKVLKVKGNPTFYASDAFNNFYRGIKFDTSGNLKALHFGYAQDSMDSYFRGEKLPDNSGNLKVTKCGYAYDSFNVYFGAQKLENVQGKIKCSGGGYAVDEGGNAFYHGKEMETSVGHFNKKEVRHIGGGYAVSGNEAFYHGKKFENAGPGRKASGLKVLKGPHGKFSNWAKSELGNIFYKGKEISSLMGQSVALLGNGWAKVAHQTFYKGEQKRVVGTITVHGNDYATDQMNAYYKGKKMNVMGQASSFKILGGDYAGSQSFAFYKGEKINGCPNPEKVLGNGYLKCFAKVFYNGERTPTCMNPRSLSHGYLECHSKYLYHGKAMRHVIPGLNSLTINADGTASDARGRKFVAGKMQ